MKETITVNEVCEVLMLQAKMAVEGANLTAPQHINRSYFYELLAIRSTAQHLFGTNSDIYKNIDHLVKNYDKPMPQPKNHDA